MKVYNSITELIGNTPLLRLHNLEKIYNLKSKVIAKIESFNPAGSAKDRVAKAIIEDFEKRGVIKNGATIIEPTSGNTGIALSAICSAKGYKAVIVMPDNMSAERIKLMKAYGAEVVLTDGKLGMVGAIAKAEELNKNTPNSVIAGQFNNPANPLAHYLTTGREIYSDTDGEVDFLVAGVGTGGTLSGTAKYLKEVKPSIKVYGVEPKNSPLISTGKSGPHKIQGIGANFIPSNFDNTVCDQILTATDEEAYSFSKILAKTEGILCGISSGATLSVAVELAKKYEGKTIVVILHDTGDRYLSVEDFV